MKESFEWQAKIQPHIWRIKLKAAPNLITFGAIRNTSLEPCAANLTHFYLFVRSLQFSLELPRLLSTPTLFFSSTISIKGQESNVSFFLSTVVSKPLELEFCPLLLLSSTLEGRWWATELPFRWRKLAPLFTATAPVPIVSTTTTF